MRYESMRLANRSELITVPDHRLPVVAVNLWGHAGPRNEAKEHTSFAHLFEHLMFAGMRQIPRGEYDGSSIRSAEPMLTARPASTGSSIRPRRRLPSHWAEAHS